MDYEICLTFPCIFLGRKSNDPDHPDYVPSITKVKSVSSQLSPHKAKKKKSKSSRSNEQTFKTHTGKKSVTANTREKCKNENITIEEQDENNFIDELKSKNCALDKQIDYLENQLQSLQKRNETLEYAKRNYKQRIEEPEGERKKLLKLSNDCQSEYQLLKSNYNINYKSVAKDENKLYFYTGIATVAIFDLVFDFVENSINQSDISKLTKKETFIMILMRLRLGLLKDLAYRFGMIQFSVSRTLHKWLPILATRLSFLVTWPRREEPRKTLPACFRESFPKRSVIIECFEIFIEKPADLTARAQTYTSYKSHNTVKILVGITPQGAISYISKP